MNVCHAHYDQCSANSYNYHNFLLTLQSPLFGFRALDVFKK